MRKRFIGRINEKKVAMFILIAVVAITFFGFIVMTLWNAILPAVLNVSRISFGQALGILLLSKILFGGFRGGGWYARRHQWRQDMTAKWASMTPEEREKFKEQWKHRCGRWGSSFNEEVPSQEHRSEQQNNRQ